MQEPNPDAPVLGSPVTEPAEESATGKILLVLLGALLWLIAAIVFGYPGIIIPALVAVPTVFTILILITKG